MSTPKPTRSAFIPTRLEAMFLSVYPLTLFFGSLFSHLNPTYYPPFTTASYNIDAQSYQPASEAPSYFAQKRNVFNVYFVKFGWFWCSLALLLFTILSSRGRPARPRKQPGQTVEEKDKTTLREESDARLRRRWQTFLRYSICTLFWTFVTQWFFGPPLIDRGFTATGGSCIRAEREVNTPVSELPGGRKTAAEALITHAACSLAGGMWRGGYDISGHVFILVIGSGMLWLEILPYLLPDIKGFGAARIIKDYQGGLARVGLPPGSSGAAAAAAVEIGTTSPGSQPPAAVRAVYDAAKEKLEQQHVGDAHLGQTTKGTIRAYATVMALVTASLSMWMLLMTAAFFHTWFEKLTGWLFAFAALYVVYFAPRGFPALREVLGMPGV